MFCFAHGHGDRRIEKQHFWALSFVWRYPVFLHASTPPHGQPLLCLKLFLYSVSFFFFFLSAVQTRPALKILSPSIVIGCQGHWRKSLEHVERPSQLECLLSQSRIPSIPATPSTPPPPEGSQWPRRRLTSIQQAETLSGPSESRLPCLGSACLLWAEFREVDGQYRPVQPKNLICHGISRQ